MKYFRESSNSKVDDISIVYPEEIKNYINELKQMKNYEEGENFNRLQQGPPKTPPPNKTPQLSDSPDASLKAVDPGAIKPCVYRFSYIWLENGKSFWAYLVYVGKKSASGWRWNPRRRRWVYFGVDLNDIKSFVCY
ncbi:hypothetical protein SH2C18_46680 [Clostridium sediminicola]|uniref:hypothetical protein n=1 Tax=Clostridium sediminicola TaxID=3114879 RepID=UPI0031F273DA